MTTLSLRQNSLIQRAATRTATVVVLGASLSLLACSYVPDWSNPVVWYDSVVSGIGGKSDAPPKADVEAVHQAQGQPATVARDSKSFPSLRDVPQQAPETSSSEERRQVAQGLVADRDNARYTEKVLRAGGTPKPQAPTQVARVAPATPPKSAPASTAVVPTSPPQPVVTIQGSQAPKAPRMAAASKLATARLPKLDLQPAPRTQMAAVPAPPPSAVPQSQASFPARVIPRPIMESESGALPSASYPPLASSVPARGRPSLVQSDQVAAPAPDAALQLVPQPGPHLGSLSGLGAAEGVLAQAFSQALAQSASTVTTAPAGASFVRPSAAPLTASQTSAPNIVREAYNQTLIAASGAAPQTAASSGTSFAAVPAGPAIVFFNNGSAGLNGKAKALIRDVADAYKARRGPLRIVGHASSRTRNLPVGRHKIVNFRVSLDRAIAVANELIKLGVDKSAIQITAVSDSQPVFFESMPEGEARNRRAEIFYAF